ncbi:MAG TPA: bifunctional 2-polyprenyl-6-hydroxyphenol methylase/3-demethylubiquinol 3-O-methyltransferase UbiG [Stellaceae bacterium]|nr:bifunctional 2-polyprenyl-6-hydroxyphenol methylase/3-demethylubiquinol 3-O-methyltransferase UbiG [Stellaceae bacterium]
MKPEAQSVDRAELARFAAIAPQWWDESGAFRPLHHLNAARLSFVRDRLAAHFERATKTRRPFAGLKLLDIGCGGGLMSEPLTRLGCRVTGIDADDAALAVARRHAREQDLVIDYRAESLESLAKKKARFDVVLALEIVEHVTDPEEFLRLAAGLVEPGGALILSTLNRTPKAYLFAIVGAEYLLRWLPRGTHAFRKFRRPSELALALRRAGLEIADMAGLNYDPVRSLWRLGPDLQVNYLIFARNPRRK